MRKCNYCGKPIEKNSGCALAITSVDNRNINIINVSFCDEDYTNFIEPILKELNNVGDLHMIFGDEEADDGRADAGGGHDDPDNA